MPVVEQERRPQGRSTPVEIQRPCHHLVPGQLGDLRRSRSRSPSSSMTSGDSVLRNDDVVTWHRWAPFPPISTAHTQLRHVHRGLNAFFFEQTTITLPASRDATIARLIPNTGLAGALTVRPVSFGGPTARV
jgi:hypothetical protein